MEQQLSPSIILSFVVGYFLVLLAIAWFTGRKGDNKSFFIGRKDSPWYLVAFGMVGASLSGVTFISIPGVIGNLGSVNGQFSYMQMVLGYLVGYTFIALVLMPLYYRMNLTSIYTYLERRFGFWSYKTGSAYFLLSRVIGASFRLFLVAIVLQRFVFDHWGIHFAFTVALTLFLIWVYTFKGGIRTIVFTDTMQTLFMLIAVGLTIYFIADGLQLSFGELLTTIKDSPYSQMFFWDPKADNYFWKQFLAGAAIATVMTGLDQDMMQKNNSCRNIKEAQYNMFSFSIILVVVNFMFVGLGALLYIYSNAKGIAIPERTDYLFPTLAIQHFTPVAGAVFLLGLIAAAYSSADSALTSLTTAFCIDFLDFEKKDTENPRLIKTRYLVHVGFTVILFGTILSFKYLLNEDVVSSLFKIAGFTYGPLLGLFFFGILLNRTVKDNWVPLVCIVAPVVCYVLNANSVAWLGGYQFGFEILILNGLLTFLGLMLISTKGTDKQLKL